MSPIREMRDVERWAKGQGWTVEPHGGQRNRLTHPQHDGVVFTSVTPQDDNAPRAARHQIEKITREIRRANRETASGTQMQHAKVNTSEIEMKSREAAPPKGSFDMIAWSPDEDTTTGSLAFDRFKVGAHAWSRNRSNVFVIVGKDLENRRLCVRDESDGKQRWAGIDEWNHWLSTPPLEKFAIGKAFWDINLVRWVASTIDGRGMSVHARNDAGHTKTFYIGDLDDLRVTRDGAEALRSKRGLPPMPPATGKPFADKLATLAPQATSNGIAATRQALDEIDRENVETGLRLVNGTSAAPSETPKDKASGNRQMIWHEFRLRRDLIVGIELPVDLNESDAVRLSNWVKALAF